MSFLCLGVIGLTSLAALDNSGRSTDVPLALLASSPIAGASLYTIGAFVKVTRLKYFVLILGVFLFFPLLMFWITPVVLLTILVDSSLYLKLFWWAVFGLVTLLLIYRDICVTRKVEFQCKYLAQEIKVDAAGAFINRDTVRDFYELSRRDVRHPRLHKLLAAGIFVMPVIIYLLQKAILGLEGDEDTMGYLSALSTPLALYSIMKMCSRYYLWIHLVGRYESASGHQVFLRTSAG